MSHVMREGERKRETEREKKKERMTFSFKEN